MPKKIKNIVIVGGGSAGWMTASTLIRFFPDNNITVIESPNIPTVGVGESTLGGIRNWTHALGIEEKDFMTHTNASYKMSIKFTDFYNKDEGGFHYPFGRPLESNEGLTDWQVKKQLYPKTPVQDYCRTYYSTMALIENNKYSNNEHGKFDGFRPELEVAYHFDAALFGKWLKDNYSLPRGVKHVAKEVVDIQVGEVGVEKLVLDDGTEVTADLFIDCTGWKSMLLGGALNEPFMSYEDMLPNNRAWAVQVPYTDKEKELEPFTNCTAIGHGWVWNIPLWSRIGTGYVYSDKFVSPEDALQEFKDHLNSDKMAVHNPNRVTDDLEFRDVKMRIGIHERTWVKNVVAIGLSSGFIEPLESNGLFTVHEFLLSLTMVLERGYGTQWDRDTYNASCLDRFNNLAEFVALHYALSIRDDTNYWEAINKKTFSDGMVKNVPTIRKGFADLVNRKMFKHSHESAGGIHCIATGMNYFVMHKINLLNAKIGLKTDVKAAVDQFIFERQQQQHRWLISADAEKSLMQYLQDNIHNE